MSFAYRLALFWCVYANRQERMKGQDVETLTRMDRCSGARAG